LHNDPTLMELVSQSANALKFGSKHEAY
jgi:hypothetical protein